MSEYTQNNNRYSVTSNILTMWDKFSRQLRISGNDDSLSIAIWIPVTDANGRRQYPKEQRISVMLTPTRAAALEDILYGSEGLLAAYAAGKDSKQFIYTNAALSTILEIALVGGEFSLNIYRNCDKTTRISNNVTSYSFSTVVVGKDYDHTTGQMTGTPVQADYTLFAKAVRGFVEMASGNIAGHGVRVTNSFQQREYMKYLNAIASACNAQLPNDNYRQNNYQQGGGQANNYDNPANAGNLPVTQFNEVGDFSEMMG